MKRLFSFIVLISLLSIIAFFAGTGCMSLPSTKNLKEKGVCVNGMVSVQNLDTGYNPVTKTFTPKLLLILARGFWSSVPLSKEAKDYIYFRIEELSSIWNSASVDKTYTFIFATQDKELMKIVLDKLSTSIKEKNKPDNTQGAALDGVIANDIPSEPD